MVDQKFYHSQYHHHLHLRQLHHQNQNLMFHHQLHSILIRNQHLNFDTRYVTNIKDMFEDCPISEENKPVFKIDN